MGLKRKQVLILVASIIWAILLFPSHSHSFATASHSQINEVAAQSTPSLDNYLKETLGFLAGLDTVISNSRGKGSRILDWIIEGGIAEDQLWFRSWWGELLGGMTRSRRHFHQPLRPWGQAGLKGLDDSSIYWAQDRNQSPGRKASWFDGRDSYLSALLSKTQKDREGSFAEAFQTLGQVMHLVADTASIPHARDDIHIFGYNFEKFVLQNSQVITGFKDFDKSIFQQPTGDSRASVPIARLWDTEIYSGTNPPGNSERQIGLAEFTNANFFSEDTISKNAFNDPELPLPAIDRLVSGPIEIDPHTGLPARYLSKNSDGVGIPHMVRIPSLFDFTSFFVGYTLDDRVYQDYAGYLLPRAVGYSAGILDYFFRGKIKIEAPDRFAYALAMYQEGNTGSFTKMRFKVSNDTDYPNTNENTQGQGQMWAVVRYRKSLNGNLFENPYANVSDPYYAVSAPQSVDLSRDSQELVFDFSANSIPTNSADIFLWVVWQGKLGQEDGTIMVGGKDLLEPDPLTFGNGTDYDCFQQSLYHVADLVAFPRYNPPTQTQRDVTHDGVQDLFGADIVNGHFIKTYDPSAPQVASLSWFDFKVTQLQAPPTSPQYSRFVLLQDQPVYAFSWRQSSSVEVPTGFTDTTPKNYDFNVYGNVNDFVVDSTGALTRRVTSNMIYRGVPTFSMYISVVFGPPRFAPCVSASFLLPEPFTRIEGELAPE